MLRHGAGVVDGRPVHAQPGPRLLEGFHGERVELAVSVGAVSYLHEAALGDDVGQVPDDEVAADVVRGVGVVGHEVGAVVDDLPVAGDGFVGEGLLGGVVVAVTAVLALAADAPSAEQRVGRELSGQHDGVGDVVVERGLVVGADMGQGRRVMVKMNRTVGLTQRARS